MIAFLIVLSARPRGDIQLTKEKEKTCMNSIIAGSLCAHIASVYWRPITKHLLALSRVDVNCFITHSSGLPR